ncbi:MAG: hypothetical protein V4447_10515 [Pseudomonadota bacterium]
MNNLRQAISHLRAHYNERKWMLSARKEIRAVDRRLHRQSAYQLAELERGITGRNVRIFLAIILLTIIGSCIDGDKPDPKAHIVEVRK